MSGPITRARLLELFDRLNEKLKQADEQGEVYIVVGAMMALAPRCETGDRGRRLTHPEGPRRP